MVEEPPGRAHMGGWVGGWMGVLVVGWMVQWVGGPGGRVWPKTMRKREPHLQYTFGTFPCILLADLI